MDREIISKCTENFVALIKQQNVSDGYIFKYIRLYANFYNSGFASYKAISSTLGVEETSVSAILKILKDANLIITQRRTNDDDDSNYGKTYIKFLVHPKILNK